MNLSNLKENILKTRNFLCVGLDTDPAKLPKHLPKNQEGILYFNEHIIAETLPYCVAYKINTAFYEAMGKMGWELLEQTRSLIPATHFAIADAKRGDIGNTSAMYAKAFFEQMDFDALTVSPYMGFDSIAPFLEHRDKTTILLALTSNKGSSDFQQLTLENGQKLYQEVLRKAAGWGENMMFVVGATQAAHLQSIREIIPNHFLLVPGVGAQGGDLEAVSNFGDMLINSSREIIYASSGEDFGLAAQAKAQEIAQKMRAFKNN